MSLKQIKTIHPFPARMAPEIAFEVLTAIPNGSTVLDPMQGSGTSVRLSAEYGHRGIGFDIDPLANLIAKTWATPVKLGKINDAAFQIIEQIKSVPSNVYLPWIDEDKETKNFIDFWFAKKQKDVLCKISYAISKTESNISETLKVALSRIIITKKKGASLGWDISHGKPHKVKTKNDFDVTSEFLKSVQFIIKRHREFPPPGNVEVKLGDARNLNLPDQSVDAVLTSPPYLHAVDYMRGHRLSLVWLGYSLSELRQIRAETIGVEKKLEKGVKENLLRELTKEIGKLELLSHKRLSFVQRYAVDLFLIMEEIQRVLRKKGKATLVIADAYSSGVLIKNTAILKNAAQLTGLHLEKEIDRLIPANKRYLPPPTISTSSNLRKRMKKEAILTFVKA